MADPQANHTEMWRALKWTAILLITLVIAFGAFKIWQTVTAPARAVNDAAEAIKSNAGAVMNRLDIPIDDERRFNSAADAAFDHLNRIPERAPAGVKARGFRMANLRGAKNRVCEMSHDFGNGLVPVFLAADNAGHEAAKAVGSDADRLIRIVVVSPEQTLGLNAEYDVIARAWTLGWRPSSVKKPYPDVWAETPITKVLNLTPKACVHL